jgi:hypothetical protein
LAAQSHVSLRSGDRTTIWLRPWPIAFLGLFLVSQTVGVGMDGSLYHALMAILGLAGAESSAQILGALLSFVFMAVMVLSKFGSLLGLLQPDVRVSLPRRAFWMAISAVLATACWVLPVFSIIVPDPTQVAMFAIAAFVITAVAALRVFGFIGTVIAHGVVHTIATVVPERHQPGAILTHAAESGPISAPAGFRGLVHAEFNSGAIIPVIAVVTCAMAYGVTEIVFGPSGAFSMGSGHSPMVSLQVNDAEEAEIRHLFGQMGSGLSRVLVMLAALSIAFLFASRYAARRGLHYEGDPFDAMLRRFRMERKSANAWQALDEAVRQHKAR